jgi:N-acetylmuramoyl-L-alanine amidase/HSP20 family molecular chaperone IbpA
MAIATSTVLPLLKLEWFTFFIGSPKTIHLYKIIYGNGEDDITVTGSAAVNWEQVCLYAFAIVSFYLLIVLCIRIIKIHRLKKKYPVQQFSEFDFISTDISSAPFSFLKNIFWRNDINLDEETGKQILQHEIIHIKQKHSWDKLFMQLILCFYWMNPFYYLLKRELYLIHEFIADEKAVQHSDADAFAKMLLTAQFGKFNFLPAQSIFYSSIKRRLIMLTTSKKPQFSYARRLMVLPLIAALVCLFAFTVKTRNTDHSIQNIKAAKPFVLVIDAGHGGKDAGAIGYGLYEKNITLKIAEKIKSLASEYNIDVILTRNNDVFMSPQEKSNFANAQNADALISVHVNADKYQPSLSGIEVVLSKNNTKFLTNNQTLGSAILQNVNNNFKTQQALQQQNIGIWVLDQSKFPSALIECGYLTNANDANNLKDDAKLELIAKNILQGVAMYANNSFDKSKLYDIKSSALKDTTDPLQSKSEAVNQPIYVSDGKIISADEMKKIDPNTIESVSVLKDKIATDKYGAKGKNGVVEIKIKPSKDSNDPIELKLEAVNQPLYVLDTKIISNDEMKKIDPNTIESINVLKDKTATDKYGVKGKNGVVEITLKNVKPANPAVPPLPSNPPKPVSPASAVQ